MIFIRCYYKISIFDSKAKACYDSSRLKMQGFKIFPVDETLIPTSMGELPEHIAGLKLKLVHSLLCCTTV